MKTYNITTVEELRIQIKFLEQRQANERQLLEEQMLLTAEEFKLVNIIKNTFKGAITSPDLKNDLLKAAVGFSTGFVANKFFLGKSNNPLTKLLSLAAEMTMGGIAVNGFDGLKNLGKKLFGKTKKTVVDEA